MGRDGGRGGARGARSWLLWPMLCRRVLGCLQLLSLFIVYLFVFSVFSWMKCLVFLFSAQRHGGPKAKRILHSPALSLSLSLCYPHLLLLTGYLLLYCFGRLISHPPTPPPLSHTCLSLTFSLSVIWQLHFFLSVWPKYEGQEGVSE